MNSSGHVKWKPKIQQKNKNTENIKEEKSSNDYNDHCQQSYAFTIRTAFLCHHKLNVLC